MPPVFALYTRPESRTEEKQDASKHQYQCQHIDIYKDGSHYHVLKSQDSSNFLSSVNSILTQWIPKHIKSKKEREPPISVSSSTNCLMPDSTSPMASFTQKYGRCTEILHYGSSSTVRLYARTAKNSKTKKLHAVKVFRRSAVPWWSTKAIEYRPSEQDIVLRLRHKNIIRAIESLYDERGNPCLTMDYCSAGDLHSLIITSGKLNLVEADCFFKQLIRAVSYLHQNGMAHRDLKTENILLTVHGAVKVCDFGSVEWFHNGVQSSCRRPYSSPKFPGTSVPYIPPEEFDCEELDPAAADIWAAGLVYIAMRTGRLLWKIASREDDSRFAAYLQGRMEEEGYPPIEGLGKIPCRNVIYAMLHPNPRRRLTASAVLRSEWIYDVAVCDAGETGR